MSENVQKILSRYYPNLAVNVEIHFKGSVCPEPVKLPCLVHKCNGDIKLSDPS